MQTARQPLQAVSTQGSLIRLADGRELIDGIASWWTACHGYNHPHIQAALRRQIDRMPHVMFGGLVHEPALKLAERLAAMTPGDLNHVFFVDSGSVAVEVAMKMAVQYWLNRGRGRPRRMVSLPLRLSRRHHGLHVGLRSRQVDARAVQGLSATPDPGRTAGGRNVGSGFRCAAGARKGLYRRRADRAAGSGRRRHEISFAPTRCAASPTPASAMACC